MIETPFRQTRSESLLSTAATLCLQRLAGAGVPRRRLGETTEHPQYGYTASATLNHTGPRFLRITDIKAGAVDWTSVPFCDCPDPGSYLLRAGDLLVARSGSVGKSFLVSEVPEPAVFASYLIRLRPKPGLLPEYGFWCLQSQQFWEQLLLKHRGSAIANVNARMLSSLEFPFPPPPTQAAIALFLHGFRRRLQGQDGELGTLPAPLADISRLVARIEELAARIGEARGLRREAVEEARVLLLSRVGQVFNCLSSRHPVRPFGSFSPHVSSGPRNWATHYEDSGQRFYRAQDVGPDGEILGDSKVFVSQPPGEQGRSATLERGDLLLVITGATVGRVAVYRDGLEPGLVSQHVAVCRLPAERLDPEFALWGLRGPAGQAQLLGQRYGQGKPGLNLSNIRALRLPCPPVPEQQIVVAELAALRAEVDKLKQLQAETTADLGALLPSILDRAFNGEL